MNVRTCDMTCHTMRTAWVLWASPPSLFSQRFFIFIKRLYFFPVYYISCDEMYIFYMLHGFEFTWRESSASFVFGSYRTKYVLFESLLTKWQRLTTWHDENDMSVTICKVLRYSGSMRREDQIANDMFAKIIKIHNWLYQPLIYFL
jgi:hypothetical protein